MRLRGLAEYCCQELANRGLQGAQPERPINGWVRTKNWDVVVQVADRVRLAISLKSMLNNLAGSVPNRSDDLIGEAADVQMRYPEIVLGYIMVMDENADKPPGRSGKWIPVFEERLSKLAVRRPPFWVPGTIEAGVILRVDFSGTPRIRTPESQMGTFFDELVAQYIARTGLPPAMDPG